ECGPVPAERISCHCKLWLVDRYECNCTDTGFTGLHCEQNIDDCHPGLCLHNGTCQDGVRDFSCLCPGGYEGRSCERDVPDCSPSPCRNGAHCLERSNASLYQENYLGLFPEPFSYASAAGYLCLCPPGYNGTDCENDIDDCASHNCVHGHCVDLVNAFRCECSAGFEGADCSHEVDECSLLAPCQNGAACHDLVADYRCDCPPDYGDKNCSTALLGCRGDPCRNGGRCEPFLGDAGEHLHRCHCVPGFAGPACDVATTVSLRNTSSWSLNFTQERRADQSLTLHFRTTLPDVRLATLTMDSRHTLVVALRDGSLEVYLWEGAEAPRLLLGFGAGLNDSRWKELSLGLYPGTVHVNVSGANGSADVVQRDATVPLSSVVLGRGDGPGSFVGCLREVRLNNALVVPAEERALQRDVQEGCLRKEQCVEGACSNGGLCVDRWDHLECRCHRPYHGERCNQSFPAATFGRERALSWTKLAVSPERWGTLNGSLSVSLFVRTRKARGLLFFLGSEPQLPEGGFLAALLHEGRLQVALRLAGEDRTLQVSSGPLDDGRLHLVQVGMHPPSLTEEAPPSAREWENLVLGRLARSYAHAAWTSEAQRQSLLVDTPQRTSTSTISNGLDSSYSELPGCPMQASLGSSWLEASVDGGAAVTEPLSPTGDAFGALRPQVLYLGWLPTHSSERVKRQSGDAWLHAITDYLGNVEHFKGVLQDMRVSARHARRSCARARHATPRLWRKLPGFTPEVEPGVVGDDVCPVDGPCRNGATCADVWNAFECVCPPDFRGRLCDELRPCVRHSCPNDSVCQDLLEGRECVSSATLDGGGGLNYRPVLRGGRPLGSVSLRYRSRSDGTLVEVSDGERRLTLSLNGTQLELRWRASASGPRETLSLPRADGQWVAAEVSLGASTVRLSQGGRQREGPWNGTEPPSLGGAVVEVGGGLRGCLREVRLNGLLLPFFAPRRLGNGSAADRFELSADPEPPRGCLLCRDGDCRHGGSCRDPAESYACDCPPAFEGELCERDVDECVEGPCLNGATCLNLEGAFSCLCADGFEGQLCERRVWYCERKPCANGGTCSDTEPGSYSCQCSEDFEGHNCTLRKIVSCAQEPCQNQGTCQDVEPMGRIAYRCECGPAFEGGDCERERDLCASGPCENGASCLGAGPGLFECVCAKGYRGSTCQEFIDLCREGPPPCLHGGRCSPYTGGFDCHCSGTGYTGTSCELDVDECAADEGLCQHGGTCSNLEGSYACACVPGRFGRHCQLNDSCWLEQPCLNGAPCSPVENPQRPFFCNCTEGFHGDTCALKSASLDSTDLKLVIGLTVACVFLLAFIAFATVFLRMAKKKRATRGTYSPSNQEMFGSRVEMNPVMKPPPEERLI
ncbi:unnamed protein product, partial [Ixodes hexagonus]